MAIEMLTFDENGQGVIDFDSLEMITNEEFVLDIKISLDLNWQICAIEKLDGYVTVYLQLYGNRIKTLMYVKEKNHIITSSFSKFDMEVAVNILGGKLEWEK